MNYPKVLVVANHSFSLANSNGRTLGGFFIGWPKEKLAQFCISTDGPNYEICDNYYCITDRGMLDACIHFRKPKRLLFRPNMPINQLKRTQQIKRTAFHILIRNLIWMSKKWKSKELNLWIQEFNPDVVLFQNSDSAFMLDIALEISRERRIPLIMFNTEAYYFFKQNYFSEGICDSIFFPLYQALYKRKFRHMMNVVKFAIHGNEILKRDYDKEFGGNSSVLYTSSTLNADNTSFNQENPVFSYLGNFGLDRPAALLEVGNVLQSINKRYHLDIYGRANMEDEQMFNSNKGVQYHGFVPYEDVIKIMNSSDILFHVEGQSERWKECLRYGFSAKIADLLASGRSFVLYSSPDVACAQYIKRTEAGWFASNKEKLEEVLRIIIDNKTERDKKLKKACDVVRKNHSVKKNREMFYNYISQVVYDAHVVEDI